MTLSRRDMILATGGAALAVAFPAWAGGHSIEGRAFGGSWRLALPTEADLIVAANVVEQVIEQVDATLSPWRESSEISRFNRSADTRWHRCGDEISEVAAASLEIADLTDGAFNPTVGPIVSRYGFGPIEGRAGRWQDIVTEPGRLRKTAAGRTLDFCGIAKGYALDRIAVGLEAQGISDALIDLGGDVKAIGLRPNGSLWRVGIERPGAPGLEMQRVVAIGAGLALATSGTAAQGYADQGRSIAHLIDPGTGRPISGEAFSVSVVAESGMRADALATALTVMGPEKGADRARGLGIDALFVSVRENVGTEVMTGDFMRHVIV
jgi:thiamine biosynthesis lipoprotein